MILDPMTPKRFDEIRRAAEHWRFGDFSLDIEELIDALETERARLDWLVQYSRLPNNEQPEVYFVTIGLRLDEIPDEYRRTIDAAMAARERSGEMSEPIDVTPWLCASCRMRVLLPDRASSAYSGCPECGHSVMVRIPPEPADSSELIKNANLAL